MAKSGFVLVGLLLVMLSVSIVALAQSGECPVIAEDVLQTLDAACSTLGRNAACYGNRRVTATFVEAVPDGFFSTVGEQARLLTLKTLTTTPPNPQTGEWGVALMKVQADIPNTLPGQSVVFVLMGDAEVENAVRPEDAFQLPDPIVVHTAAPVRLFALPSETSDVVGDIEAGGEILVDVVSQDGQWVRTTYQNHPAWLLSISLVEADAISELPAISRETFTPAQAFYFRTGIGQPGCEQAPDLLLVQGPENFAVDIRANGADIRIGSTIVVKTSPSKDTADIITVSGKAVIYPDTPDAITVPAGYMAGLCLSPAENLGIDGSPNDYRVIEGCVASPPAPLTDEQRAQIAVVEHIPSSVLNYAIKLPAPQPACTPNPNWFYTYTVQSGDTVSRLALIFKLTAAELMQANCLTGDLIFSGQSLRVPFQYTPPSNPPTQTPASPTIGPSPTPTDTPISPPVNLPPPDADGDGIEDAKDNCPQTANPDQGDWNRNGVGDACEDADGDGLTDAKEFNIGTKPDDPDSDDDALDDGKEVAMGTKPLNPDSDGDFLKDGEEVRLGTNPLNPDTDGDQCIDSRDKAPLDPKTC